MKTICKVFGHKMYSINWDQMTFSVFCTRCGNKWERESEIF